MMVSIEFPLTTNSFVPGYKEECSIENMFFLKKRKKICMAMPVKEIAKQKIDMLSQDDIMELLGFLNALEQRHECAKEENQGELRHALEELRETCGADNWDGYGACALHKESYQEALRLLQYLPTMFPQPDVAADPDGTVAFEWSNGPRQVLSLSIGNHGELVYAGIFDKSCTHGTEYVEHAFPRILVEHLQRVFE
jgi:hypothetical protein